MPLSPPSQKIVFVNPGHIYHVTLTLNVTFTEDRRFYIRCLYRIKSKCLKLINISARSVTGMNHFSRKLNSRDGYHTLFDRFNILKVQLRLLTAHPINGGLKVGHDIQDIAYHFSSPLKKLLTIQPALFRSVNRPLIRDRVSFSFFFC